MIRRSALAALLLLGGCQAYPRDTGGTLDHIRASQTIRVGIVEGDMRPIDRARVAAYLGRVGQAAGAAPALSEGAAEPLLERLKAGELDLVMGVFAEDSPWKIDVMMVEPIRTRPRKEKLALNPVARNGEHRWIMLLETSVREMGAP